LACHRTTVRHVEKRERGGGKVRSNLLEIVTDREKKEEKKRIDWGAHAAQHETRQ
jgi:hypothetical protein